MVDIKIQPHEKVEGAWEIVGPKDEVYGGIEQDDDSGLFIVDWGEGYGWRRRFQTFAEAEQFVCANAGDIEAGTRL